MAIDFSCPNCATRFKLGDAMAGKMGRCNKCDHRFKIPAAAPAAAAAVATTGRFHLCSVNTSLKAIAAADGGAAVAVAPRLTSNVSLVPITQKTLQRIARATNGGAYSASRPEDLGNVLVDALSQRTCRPNCG